MFEGLRQCNASKPSSWLHGEQQEDTEDQIVEDENVTTSLKSKNMLDVKRNMHPLWDLKQTCSRASVCRRAKSIGFLLGRHPETQLTHPPEPRCAVRRDAEAS